MPTQIEDVKLEHIERYLLTLKGLAANTQNTYITALQSFGHWCADHNWPCPTKKLKKRCCLMVAQRVIDQKQYEKIISVCDPREKDIIQFLSFTGLRAREFLDLRPENLSPDRKYLQIIGKGQKPRIVPLNDTCREILARHPMNFTKNLTYCKLNGLCKRLGKKADVAFVPHSLRHYFATQLMLRGVPISYISKCLGHSSVTITEKIYIHWCNQDLVGVTDVLDK